MNEFFSAARCFNSAHINQEYSFRTLMREKKNSTHSLLHILGNAFLPPDEYILIKKMGNAHLMVSDFMRKKS